VRAVVGWGMQLICTARVLTSVRILEGLLTAYTAPFSVLTLVVVDLVRSWSLLRRLIATYLSQVENSDSSVEVGCCWVMLPLHCPL